MEQIPIGVAGLNNRGRHWIRLLQRIPGYRVTALCDVFGPLVQAARSELDYPEGVGCYTRYEEFLADPSTEAVALCVRSRAQGAMAAAALEAGKHVNAEVPMAHSLEDCWRIVRAAETTGRIYHLAEQGRYAGYVEAWRQLRSSGALGEIELVEGQYLHDIVEEPLYYFDADTGRRLRLDELDQHPNRRPTELLTMPPIHYLPHELSPLLKVLDDRVVQVVGMSARVPSRRRADLPCPDVQMAMMKTGRGAIMRMVTAFQLPHPRRNWPYHWQHLRGTRGFVEGPRAGFDRYRLWLDGQQMHDAAEVDWSLAPASGPPEAAASGHGGLDYYPHARFRDAVLDGAPPDIDVYQAADTAAPAILAAESIEAGSLPMAVPDFRPDAARPAGQRPKTGEDPCRPAAA